MHARGAARYSWLSKLPQMPMTDPLLAIVVHFGIQRDLILLNGS